MLIKTNKFSMIPDGSGRQPVRDGPRGPAPLWHAFRQDALWGGLILWTGSRKISTFCAWDA